MPDGFLDATTSLATAAVAAGAVGLAVQRAGTEVREAGAPLAGLTSAFVFAVQMVNFPVGAGTSGHLLGGALATVLVGPWTAVLAMTAVLLVQALLFADGGLTALGTNVLLMAVVGVVVAHSVVRATTALLPRRPGSVVPAVAAAAFASVPLTALAFTGLYAVGGAVPVPLGALVTAMLGWHLLIGVGEAVITGAVVGAVVASRPDLVHAARHLRPPLVLVGADGRPTAVQAAVPTAPVPGEPHASTRPVRRPVAVGLAVSLVVAGLVSLAASASPDGLEHVAATVGFAGAAEGSPLASSPLADYAVRGIGAPALAGGLAGLVGVVVTLAVGGLAGLGAARAARRRVRS